MISGSSKIVLKRRRFQDIEDVHEIYNGTERYSTITVPKQAKCIAAQGEYFEKVTPLSKLYVYSRYETIKSFRKLHSHTSYFI
jgi:L-amino acid N-acyltransferase YncA